MTVQDYSGLFDGAQTMLSGLSSWQSICGVSTAAEAAENIYFIGTEDDGAETLAPCIILDFSSLTMARKGSRLHGDCGLEARFELKIPSEECDTIKTQAAWVLSQFSALLADIDAALVGDAAMMVDEETIQVSLLPKLIDPDMNHGRVEWSFAFVFPVTVI